MGWRHSSGYKSSEKGREMGELIQVATRAVKREERQGEVIFKWLQDQWKSKRDGVKSFKLLQEQWKRKRDGMKSFKWLQEQWKGKRDGVKSLKWLEEQWRQGDCRKEGRLTGGTHHSCLARRGPCLPATGRPAERTGVPWEHFVSAVKVSPENTQKNSTSIYVQHKERVFHESILSLA